MWRGCGQKGHVRGMNCRGSGEVCRVCRQLQQLCFTKPALFLCIPAGKLELTNEHAHEKPDMEIELVFSRLKSLHFPECKTVLFAIHSHCTSGSSSNRYIHTRDKYIHGCMIKKKIQIIHSAILLSTAPAIVVCKGANLE